MRDRRKHGVEIGPGDDGRPPASFFFYLIASNGRVVDVCERHELLRPGDVVALGDGQERWQVQATLGQVARVQIARPEGRAEVLRVSASSEAVARAFAAELGIGAEAADTANGWIVSVSTAGEPRVGALARLAAAARRVAAGHPGAELFVLDQARPFRIPPPM